MDEVVFFDVFEGCRRVRGTITDEFSVPDHFDKVVKGGEDFFVEEG